LSFVASQVEVNVRAACSHLGDLRVLAEGAPSVGRWRKIEIRVDRKHPVGSAPWIDMATLKSLTPEASPQAHVMRACVACAASEMQPLADLGLVPVLSGVTFERRADALASRAAPMELAFWPACCLVYNIAFDESLIDYDVDYDNTLHHSRTFQVYASDLAQRLARDYGLDGRQVAELGCGKGHFLVELCRAAGCRGIGFDRSYAGDVEDSAVTFVRDYMPWDDHPPLRLLRRASCPGARTGSVGFPLRPPSRVRDQTRT